MNTPNDNITIPESYQPSGRLTVQPLTVGSNGVVMAQATIQARIIAKYYWVNTCSKCASLFLLPGHIKRTVDCWRST